MSLLHLLPFCKDNIFCACTFPFKTDITILKAVVCVAHPCNNVLLCTILLSQNFLRKNMVIVCFKRLKNKTIPEEFSRIKETIKIFKRFRTKCVAALKIAEKC